MKQNLGGIAEPLLEWYRENKRPLPWRADREPYHIWISEIMLQQTRIEAVMDYYARFLKALPTVEALSAVSDEELLKLWEGLGYYSRARNLKKAAQKIMSDYGGAFPKRFEELKRLPGIGDYTAGAIASLCFDEPVCAVDGNVLRVLARLTGSRKNVLLPEAKKDAEALLKSILPKESGNFNEGLMELGETVCLPNGMPLCERCPLGDFCTAKKEATTQELPVRIKQTKRKKEVKTVLIMETTDGRLALEKREEKGLLAGLYQLPHLDKKADESTVLQQLAVWGVQAESVAFLKDTKHIFTHIEWQLHCYRVTVKKAGGDFIWATKEAQREKYPLPTAFKKCLP